MSISTPEQNQVSDLPAIHKAIFKVGGGRTYSFDVNEDITIYLLKKMLIVAAGLGPNLRIFHEGTEYTHNDPDCLNALFPSLTTVVFEVSLAYGSIEEFDELVKLNLSNKYCNEPLHFGKYPYFYCYSCGKSICSECLKDGKHNGHEIKEKYDYLQSSKILADKLFQNINDEFLDDKNFFDEKYLLEMKDKIKMKYFNSLVTMLRKIENKLVYVVETFLEREKGNLNNIRNNMSVIKKDFADGLDELKDKISIEDMMINEEIFLTFDKKFKEIDQEKEKIFNNIQAYNQFKEQLKQIEDSIERIYNDIYAFLEKYLTSDIYEKLLKDVKNVDSLPISRKAIFEKLLKGIKENDKSYKSSKKWKINLRGKNDFTDNKKNLMEIEDFKDNKNVLIPPQPSVIQISKPTPTILSVNTLPLSSTVTEQHEEKSFERKISFSETQYICYPLESKKEILIYETSSQKVKSTPLPQNLLLQEIPSNSAWINFNNYLYISGGEISGKISKNLIKYDPRLNKIELLSQIPDNKEYHSMCYDEFNNLYLIGGLTKTVLKYSISENKWTKFNNQMIVQRNHPICFVKESTLYVFFGKNMYENFENNFEKTNINGKNNFVLCNAEDVNLEYSGVMETVRGEFIFFGGRNENGPTNTSIKFNPENNTFEKCNYLLKESCCFHESVLPSIGENCLGNFSLEKIGDFVKLNIKQ